MFEGELTAFLEAADDEDYEEDEYMDDLGVGSVRNRYG
jgi:hypothetical protein